MSIDATLTLGSHSSELAGVTIPHIFTTASKAKTYLMIRSILPATANYLERQRFRGRARRFPSRSKICFRSIFERCRFDPVTSGTADEDFQAWKNSGKTRRNAPCSETSRLTRQSGKMFDRLDPVNVALWTRSRHLLSETSIPDRRLAAPVGMRDIPRPAFGGTDG